MSCFHDCNSSTNSELSERFVTPDRSRAEKLWLVYGLMGDVMLCDRERDIHPSQKFDATIHSEKMTFLTIVLFCKR
jgi:hypothetical protein